MMLGLTDRNLTRLVSALSCSYLLWVFAALWRHTQLFRSLVSGLGADTPASTGFLFDNYVWFYPLLYLGVVVVLVGQGFFARRIVQRKVRPLAQLQPHPLARG